MPGLVLARKRGQQIVIRGDIIITVMAIRGSSKVQLHISAPEDVSVNRFEVEEAINAAKAARPYVAPDELDNFTGL